MTYSLTPEEFENELVQAGISYGQQADYVEKRQRETDLAERIEPNFITETLPSAFKLGNDIVAPIVSKSFNPHSFSYDPEYKAVDDLGEFADSPYIDLLLGSRSAEHMQALKTDIEDREKDRDMLSRANGSSALMASLAAGVASPLTLLPGAAIVKGARGAKVGQSIIKSSGIGVAAMAPSEYLLRKADPTRSEEETAFTLGGAAVLSGLLGGAAAKITRGKFDALAAKLEADINNPAIRISPSQELDAFMKMDDSVGAARVQKVVLEDLEITGKAAQRISRMSGVVNPYNRLINSPFVSSRLALVEGFETALQLTAHADGRTFGVAAETLAKSFDKYRAATITAVKDGFAKMKLERGSPNATMSFSVFREGVSRALRSGDIDAKNPFITEVAQRIRKEVLEPVKQEAIDSGLLKADVAAKFAQSYLHRIWKKEALIAKPQEAMAMLKNWASGKLMEVSADLNQRIAGAQRMYERRISDLMNKVARAEAVLAREKLPAYTKPSAISEQEDSVVEFMGREIEEAQVSNYLSQNNLEEIAHAVNIVNARMPKKPMGLYDFAKSVGGLIDENGELASLGIRFGRKKILENQGQSSFLGAGDSQRGAGRRITLDDFTERALEQGFYAERPSINEVLEDLADDFNGTAPKHSINDSDKIYEYYETKQMKEYAEEFLSEIPDIDPKTFWQNIKEILSDRKAYALEIKAEAKAKGKDIREGAKRLQEKQKPIRVELKKLRNAQDAAARKVIKQGKKEIDKLLKRRIERSSVFERELNMIDSQTADDMAGEVFRTLTGVGDQNSRSWMPAITRGPLKNKLLDIPDNLAEPFLENDIGVVLNSYVNKMAGDIPLTNKFGRADMREQLQDLDDEFQEALLGAKTAKERKALERQYRSDRHDLENMRDLLRGTFHHGGDPDSWLTQGGIALRDLTYMTSMGGVTMSSLSDSFRHVMVNGIERSFGDLIGKMNLNKELQAMQLKDLKSLGFALERVLASRLSTLADITDPFARGTMLTRFTGEMAQTFSKATLINHWNDLQKSFAATVTQNRIIKILEKGKAAPKEDIAYLRFLGIDDGLGAKILEQYKKYGALEGEARLSGASKWDIDDAGVRNAKRAFEGALRKEADSVVVTKGIADAPIFSNTPIGRILLQFTGYMFASHQRVLMRGLQQADAGVLAGSLMMVAAGSLIAALKNKEAELSAELSGRAYKGVRVADWSTEKWLYEGVDRSGLIGIVMDGNNRFEKLGGYGATRALGISQASRFTNRNKLGVFLGPAAGDMEQLIGLGIKPFTAEALTKTDVHNARANIPFQNVTGFRFLFDVMEGKANETFTEE